MFDSNDFKGYRNLLGFNSQNAFKEFLGAKDTLRWFQLFKRAQKKAD